MKKHTKQGTIKSSSAKLLCACCLFLIRPLLDQSLFWSLYQASFGSGRLGRKIKKMNGNGTPNSTSRSHHCTNRSEIKVPSNTCSKKNSWEDKNRLSHGNNFTFRFGARRVWIGRKRECEFGKHGVKVIQSESSEIWFCCSTAGRILEPKPSSFHWRQGFREIRSTQGALLVWPITCHISLWFAASSLFQTFSSPCNGFQILSCKRGALVSTFSY